MNHSFRYLLSTTILFSAAASLFAQEDETTFLNRSKSGLFRNRTQLARIEEKREEFCGCEPKPMRMEIRHIEANGIGYKKGYTTLDFFLGKSWEDYLSFLDLRAHVFNDGKFAFNAGLGTRFLMNTRVRGVNLYYDYRNSAHQHYNQLGLGLEDLGVNWDYRINGYVPLGKTQSHSFGPTLFSKFKGNELILKRKKDFAMYGVHAEVAYHFNKWGDVELYPAIGPYWFGKDDRNAWGGQFRLDLKYKDYVTLEGSVSYDSVFHDLYQGQITLSLPFGPRCQIQKRECIDCCDLMMLRDRMTQPVYREEIIVEDSKHTNFVAIDPATGQPWNFIFVNNLNGSNGTFEDPFATLATALQASKTNDVIYIYPGDGTTKGLNGNAASFQMLDGQQFLGAGIAQSITTQMGTVSIPPQAVGMPHLTANGDVNVVRMANNTLISGLRITATGGNVGCACISTLSPSSSMTIVNNLLEPSPNFSGNNVNSVFVTTVGTCQVSNNTITGNNFDGASGIFIFSNSTAQSVVCSNNVITGLGINVGGETGIFVGSTANNVNIEILNNSVDRGFVGVEINTSSGTTLALVENNHCSNMAASALTYIFETLTNGSSKLVLINNVDTSTKPNVVSLTSISSNNSYFCNRIQNNTFSKPISLSQLNTSIFNLEPFTGNIPSTFTPTGTITNVPQGFCQP